MTADIFQMLDNVSTGMADIAASSFGVFIRVGAMMALAPAFGEQVVPVRVRLALTLAFTAITAPAVAPIMPVTTLAPGPLVTLVTAEALAGLVLGIGLRLLTIALQIAGTIAAQATSLSQFFGGAGVDPQPAMSQILVMAGLALAVTLGLHVTLAELILLSYQFFPPARFPDAASLAEWGVAHVARAFTLAFTLAMPFVILSLIFYVALGAINKAMPQLMVAFVGAPAITWAGLAVLFLTAPLMLPIWHEAFLGFLHAPEGLPR
ncbi:flagellar biosynthetic protein FliR [Roseinatronobacter monicus]|uniref:Flagellar biosynthetic protein FliR n=1 Tax=Roseinatronobacter monicus TaxID=393481 RepID=A0A543KE44_9RHOB|nr:flagellar biosynthetic protein FliR [Roseinatronobacter monicus]TQM93342.1 flagellar biosynthetic protein FliR [Roseinatronobacter monicus]